MDRSAKFWNRIAQRYSKQPIADEVSYRKKLQIKWFVKHPLNPAIMMK